MAQEQHIKAPEQAIIDAGFAALDELSDPAAALMVQADFDLVRTMNPAPETKLRPLTARYATKPPKTEIYWLETAHFMPPEGETVLLAWPRKEDFTFRTGRFNAGKWRLSGDTEPRQKPVFFATLNS